MMKRGNPFPFSFPSSELICLQIPSFFAGIEGPALAMNGKEKVQTPMSSKRRESLLNTVWGRLLIYSARFFLIISPE